MNRAEKRAQWVARHRHGQRYDNFAVRSEGANTQVHDLEAETIPQELRDSRAVQRQDAASINLHIDQLVVQGFALGARYAISDSMQSELTRLLGESERRPQISQGFHSERIDAGSFQMKADAKPVSIGAQIAGAVYRGWIG